MRFPTRNVNADLHEMASRNALPLPVAPVQPNRGNTMSMEQLAAQFEAQRQAEKVAQRAIHGAPTIGAGVVNCLDILMGAVEDQRQGRELDLPTIHAAVAQLGGLLAAAHQRGLGRPVGVTFENREAST